jgi:hypothetical protein
MTEMGIWNTPLVLLYYYSLFHSCLVLCFFFLHLVARFHVGFLHTALADVLWNAKSSYQCVVVHGV